MKLRCILITLALVEFSPIMTEKYVKSVYTTNKLIKIALTTDISGLMTAIKSIINGDSTIEEIELMLAIPEKCVLFNMPVWCAIAEQEAIQRKIYLSTDIPEVELSEYEVTAVDFLGLALLEWLGETRRTMTGQVTKILLLAVIHGEEPAFLNLTELCRLTAVIRSIRFPDAFINTACVDSGVCTLTSQDGSVYKYKRFNDTIVMEIQIAPNEEEYELLTEQVEAWYPDIDQQP